MSKFDAIHLGYHFVQEGSAPGLNCPPNRLRSQIMNLRDRGYEILSCGEVAKRVLDGKPIPEKHATLSFDDGLKSQFEIAAPILRELNVPATFFYITSALEDKLPPVMGFQILIRELGAKKVEEVLGEELEGTFYKDLLNPKRYDSTGLRLGEPEEMRVIKLIFNGFLPQSFKKDLIRDMFERFMGSGSQDRFAKNWFINADELIQMQNQGLEIGSHSDSHPQLEISGKESVLFEAATSKAKLEEVLDRPVKTFGYPFGLSRTARFAEDIRGIIARQYSSGWNFHASKESISEADNPYINLSDIPRLAEQAFSIE